VHKKNLPTVRTVVEYQALSICVTSYFLSCIEQKHQYVEK